ncbi:PGC-1 and ERR-induced regulator in muscle protein 1-like [Anguilla rostrata]|uniref:PGC-1 and ERR-induced regulator in muscle protein 1-like n=1 Tax=Anguilla rostrata TaxID=7938 RepID=UPI0030D1AB0B
MNHCRELATFPLIKRQTDQLLLSLERSGQASPTAYSQCETSLSDRTSSIVYSLCETSLSGRASPTVYSLCETSLSELALPIVCSLSEIRLSDRDSPIVSLCDRAPSALSLPETYDYFFSDFEAGNIFFPSIRSLSADTGVPIFSCSRSVKREFQFAEEYDCVFPEESPVESEDEDRHSPIHVVTCFDDQPHGPLDALDEHFFIDKDWRGSLFGRNLLSLRRLRFTGGLYSSRDRSTSWAFAATGWRERSSLFSTTDPGNPMDDRGRSHSHPNLYLENQLCNEFREQRDTGMQAVVSFPRKGFLFTLRQSDICLVCIAFASWVLKSANPQSADTWKTALLANVSAISAIQYLRRYMREDASENKR